MLEQIHVRNFKAIDDASLELTPLHLLIGPNDTGKTTFLEAIAALSRSLDHPILQAFLGRWTGRQLVHSEAEEPNVTIEGRLTGLVNGSYRLSCDFPSANKTVQIREAIWNDGQAKNILYGHDTLTGYSSRPTAATQPHFEDALNLANALCPCWYLRWSAQIYRCLRPYSRSNLRLAGNGFGLPTLLDDLLGHDRSRFDAVESQLRERFPDVQRLMLQQEAAYNSPVDDPEQTLTLQAGNGKQLYFVLQNGAEIPAPQVAEGMLYVLAYLAIINLPNPPRILLVEEPENGIHPARVSQIVQLLRDVTVEHKETQVVMASHSPYLVDEMQPEEVTWCKRENGHIVTERLDKNETVRRQQGLFELGEIWSNYLDPLTGEVASE